MQQVWVCDRFVCDNKWGNTHTVFTKDITLHVEMNKSPVVAIDLSLFTGCVFDD